ncbi:cobyric acid synthase [Halobacillus litoralis]|uniref:Cobyric acid synthase n=1 Tax=Halobacillus litoralis TaxID=45668 RepID=A0A410MC98_9BACI|nr:cobyric acid synthase [Halobacillus litoralis]QAS52303.1 cobyric acid synthase CobQ [Halobacillus litoralis]
MKGIMVQGTASNVGKSLVVTAICRWLTNQGYRVAPFKSQNMSNNSYVTEAGTEIGRAQGVQAEACKTIALPEMNPILLKPKNDQTSEVICLGKSVESCSGKEYRTYFYEAGKKVIEESLAQLEKHFDFIVIEGAGSPVEVNLNDRELVNMAVADIADMPVILVADIDRGGVFASIVGTLQLLPEADRRRVKGIIINKFRGDPELFNDGVDWLERYTGIPVLGVLPYTDHEIEAEDSLSIRENKVSSAANPLDIAVVVFPYLSNFTDVDPFYQEEDVSIRYVSRKEELGRPDAVILPGTRSTVDDLEEIRNRGIEEKLLAYIREGGTVAGICGGYQVLTEQFIEGDKVMSGMGIFPITTIFQEAKKTRRIKGTVHSRSGFPSSKVEGYEIHHGDMKSEKGDLIPLFYLENEEEGAVLDGGRIIGTHLHHVFHNEQFRKEWLNRIRIKKDLPIPAAALPKKDPYDQLAEMFESEVDTDTIFSLVNNEEFPK